MADKEWPQGADPAETLQGGDIIGVYQPGATGGSLNRQTTVEGVALTPVGKRTLTTGRFDSEELVSGTLSVTGWYTIAETEDVNFKPQACEVSFVISDHVWNCKISAATNNTARDFINTHIEIISKGINTLGAANRINGFRLAKSDSVPDAGFKIQVNLTLASGQVAVSQISKNISRSTDKGFFLVAPFLDNTPTLPDGVTAGTFLEAGEEVSFDTNITLFFSDFIGRRHSDDQLRCSVLWPEIPKQGTNIVITLPSVSLTAVDGAGNTTTISGAHTISNFGINGKHIEFIINETGAFAGLNIGIAGMLISGTGCKLTIT